MQRRSAQPQENDDLKSGPKVTSKVIQKVTEKDHLCQVVNNHRAVGDSLEKSRVAPFLEHSPISLTLPLSSPKGDGLRNNSSSHSRSASFRNKEAENTQRKYNPSKVPPTNGAEHLLTE